MQLQIYAISKYTKCNPFMNAVIIYSAHNNQCLLVCQTQMTSYEPSAVLASLQ